MTIYFIRGKNHLLAGKRNFWTEQQLWKGLFLETYMDQNEKIPGSPNVIKLSLPWLTKDTFLLTISIEFQVERLWEIGISSTRGYCFNQHQNDLRVIYILAARRFLSPKWALTLYNFTMIFPCNFLSPSTPIKDRNRISPYNINWISRGQVTRMKKNINEGEHKLIQY